MKNISIKISKEDMNKSFKTSIRTEMIELGIYNIYKNKTFKSKKTYSRKDRSYMAD